MKRKCDVYCLPFPPFTSNILSSFIKTFKEIIFLPFLQFGRASFRQILHVMRIDSHCLQRHISADIVIDAFYAVLSYKGREA